MTAPKKTPTVILITVGIILYCSTVWAHGVSYELLEASKTITFKTVFSSGEPISYGEVLIFSPEDSEIEYQNGRTDKLGQFSFLPNKNGKWKIEINGGMGHKIFFDIDITDLHGENKIEIQNKPTTFKSSLYMRIALGISLIFNMFLASRIIWIKKA
ncbi:hypothetical protein [Maridesulfovibrio frigidus]|uniref:hypothetical protein n=1 Tax=Maridesulfovibrio frigidus TaxID=340956 RepID=UPI0004E1E27C|nr:hypothetical protein [Maridesulfovibrio frigidus]